MSEILETPIDFAKRTGLPEKVIRSYVKQGRLPHLVTGKCHVRIHVDSALEALRVMAEDRAQQIACERPVPLKSPSVSRKLGRSKYPGRTPDSVRLARNSN